MQQNTDKLAEKIVFCAPLFAERRIASIFDFIFDFWYANNLRLKFKKGEVSFAFKKTFFDHFCSTRFIFLRCFCSTRVLRPSPWRELR